MGYASMWIEWEWEAKRVKESHPVTLKCHHGIQNDEKNGI